MLQGSYRFRYVAPYNYNNAGNIIAVVAASGVITFNGAGTYTIAAGSTYIDNTANGGKSQEFPANSGGSYAISSAGIGYVESPLASIPAYSFDAVESGTVSDGVFTGSATESLDETGTGLNDIFVAMLVGTPPTNSTFTSPYWLGALDFSGGGDVLLKNAIVEIAPNGSGGLGNLSITGFDNDYQPGTLLTQTAAGATYSFAADGGATLTLPMPSGVTSAANALLSGSRLMYVSSDGNFTLGWNPTGYDIIFGVKALTTPAKDSMFSGLYYLANLSDGPPLSGQANSGCGAESFYGSENADGQEDQIVHERFFSQVCSATGDSTDFGVDDYQLSAIASNGTFSDTLGNYYALGAAGNAFVSVSNSSGYYSLTIGIHAPSFSGSGVYLDPIGVVNAASWQPITAGFAPGELFTLFGSGLSKATLSNSGGQPFGTSLGTTQVLVNGEPAPIYYVSPNQVSAIMPYATASSTTGYAEIQVNNGGILSNQVQVFLTDANSGYFSQEQDGIGDAIAEHANGSLVTQSNPAQPGETIVLALTGMGSVTPPIVDGSIGPSGPLSYANNFTTANELLVYFNDYINNSTQQQATVSFAGLYPGLAGLYQMNVVVPTTVGPGDVYIEVITDEADVEEVTVCVTGSCTVEDPSVVSKLVARPALTPIAAKALAHLKAPPHMTKMKGRGQITRPGSLRLRAPAAPAVSSTSRQ
jgi:uncharacterized protein (TIGR03437 family)